MADEEKKIFIDEDWKAQVEKEKSQYEEAAEEAVPAPEAGDFEEPQPGQMPEATLMNLVGSLATQAMLALGVIAQQNEQQVMVDLGQAKYCIDTLAMLKEKTEGNTTEQEAAELMQVVSELQQVFVARAQQVQEQEMRQAGIDLNNLKGDV